MDLESNLTDELARIDETIAEKEAAIERGVALDVLMNTNTEAGKAFKLVILDGYLLAEAKRLFNNLTTPSSLRRDSIENTQEGLAAVRHFKSYIGTATYPGIVRDEAERAPDELAQERDERLRVTAEGAE